MKQKRFLLTSIKDLCPSYFDHNDKLKSLKSLNRTQTN